MVPGWGRGRESGVGGEIKEGEGGKMRGREEGVPGKGTVPGERKVPGRAKKEDTRQGVGGMPGREETRCGAGGRAERRHQAAGRRDAWRGGRGCQRRQAGTARQGRRGRRRSAARRRLRRGLGARAERVAHLLPRGPRPGARPPAPCSALGSARRLRRCSPKRGRRRERLQRASNLIMS